LDLDVRTEPLFKPPFALARERVRDQALGVSNVREVSKPNDNFVRGVGERRQAE
jgi:hypothetical protein